MCGISCPFHSLPPIGWCAMMLVEDDGRCKKYVCRRRDCFNNRGVTLFPDGVQVERLPARNAKRDREGPLPVPPYENW